MDASELTVQRYLRATCIECEDQRHFDLDRGDGDRAVGVFTCRKCGHEVVVDLDPE